MDRNGVSAVIILFLLMIGSSNASLLSAFRIFVAVASTDSNQVSPAPKPSLDKTTSYKTIDSTNKVVGDSNNSSKPKDNDNNSKSNTKRAGPPAVENKGQTTKIEKQNKTDSKIGDQNCTGMLRWCKDDASLVACILNSEPEHKTIMVLVQNDGEGNLKVDISAPDHVEKTLAISKHQTKKINLTIVDNNKVVLSAGNGECVLRTDIPGSQGNAFFKLPSYDRLVTPINGAYFLIFTVLLFGGMSICCLFRKRSQQNGIPYQELEMGLPESNLASNIGTAEGWDQGWDDDWDEENAVKSPAAQHSGNISSNGLTSRTSKKEGWEMDWDD